MSRIENYPHLRPVYIYQAQSITVREQISVEIRDLKHCTGSLRGVKEFEEKKNTAESSKTIQTQCHIFRYTRHKAVDRGNSLHRSRD